MIASYSTALLDRPGLRVAVAATDPVRAADLAARVALAGHRFVETATEADLVLADAEARAPAGVPVLRLDAQAGLPLSLSPAQLGAAIRAVAVGLRVALPQRSTDALLTPREVEILACLGEGMSNKAIARKLGISAHTVKFHLEAVFTKLAAASRAEAVAKGLRRGLINL
ncbi:MAG: LuxR C-terminal-related transcriptional regulator [Pseudomonadota bacterium]|nr:LuxR C-terminal-related transcriptional regulator [Pseudomonadota bacterium]